MSEPTSGRSDRFAVQRANIRDTAKWMASAYAVSGPIVVAGISFSGLGALSPTQLTVTGLAVAVAFFCLLAATKSILDILIGEQLFATGIDPKTKAYIDEHAVDILPPEHATYDAFLAKWKEATAQTKTLWDALVLAAANRPVAEATAAQQKYEASAAVVNAYNASLRDIVGLAHLHVMQRRLKEVRRTVALLTVVTMLSLILAVWIVSSAKCGCEALV